MNKPIHNRSLYTLLICLTLACIAFADSSAPAWPNPTPESHPWSRWWWMGSAVDEANLSQLLEQYHQAGIGGLEICPIYGAKGYEDKFIDFLTPKWMKMLDHTITEANRLDMGIDLTTGTGWPFGGPMISKDIASAGIILKKLSYENNTLSEPLPKGKLQYLTAISSDGQKVNLTDKVKNGELHWAAPDGQWEILAAVMKSPVQKVKRSAPGGDGYVMDPYSIDSLEKYLKPFDESLAAIDSHPRCHFHDSFEYYGATWTPDFFEQFKARRGYDLRDHIEALFGIGSEGTVSRVMSDYHETISELHIDVISKWTQWCHSKGSLSRNQAHGAPANLIDLYGASDIPETEIFRSVEQKQYPMLKFSSSAAHLNGTKLVSSETFTWLNEHFQTTLADLKEATDFMFLSGINHIFFHGIPYSPKEAIWPGWQFYASVNFSPDGGLWKDLPEFNSYITRCQSILQSGKPDNDILLYLPIYDIWNSKDKLHMTFTVHNQEQWLQPSSFHRAAMELWQNGYTYDAVSDNYLAKASYKNGKIIINESEYDAIVIPHSKFMPVNTMAKLITLAQNGATILFQEQLPGDVPGLADLKNRQNRLLASLKKILPNIDDINSGKDALPQANIIKTLDNGTVMMGELLWMLQQTKISREHATDLGISFIRRARPDGYDYFLKNQGSSPTEGWVKLAKTAQSAVIMDPLFDNHIGIAKIINNKSITQVYLQLKPGQSLILRTYTNNTPAISPWQYTSTADSAVELKGTWKVKFIDGGPTLPQGQSINTLKSWTGFDDKEAERFFGTARYTLQFSKPAHTADNWTLDLGQVCNSARVTLNGTYLGTLWSKPFQVNIGPYLTHGTNTLQLDVTNLAANRIRDLDINKVDWKYFYNINLVNINYKPFDASGWPIMNSGLLGPVKLIPLQNVDPANKTKAVTSKPTLYIIGDSTVHNSTSGLMGWGDAIGNYFDQDKITVKNFARGGRSSRTFISEGLWQNIYDKLKPGDFVLMQFGHNDGGSIDTGRARASIKGTGRQTQEVTIKGKNETVHTYGWYMSKYITDTKAKGATPIVVSQVPRNRWINGKIELVSDSYGKWARESAETNNAIFIDLNTLVAKIYSRNTKAELDELYFPTDHTHTSRAGAQLNAKTLIKAILQIKDCPLSESIISE